MRIPCRLIPSGFLFFAAATVAFAMGRAPKHPASAWPLLSAKRVFLRALPAAGDGYYVVWNSSGSAEGLSVFAERFGVDDSAQWPVPGLELARGLEDAGLWDACSDGQGGLIAAALENNQLTIRRVNPEGKVLWNKLAASSADDSPVTSIVGVEDGEGGAFLAWAQGLPDDSIVWVQRWNASGRPVWPLPGARAAPTEARQTQPNILRDGQGSVLVAWKSYLEEVTKVRAQRFTSDGQRLWVERGMDVISPAGDLRQRIIMAAPGNGGVVVAWSQGVAGINRLYFQHVGADGTRTWSTAGETESGALIQQWNPVLVGSGDGNVWIGWEEVRDGRETKVMLVRRGPPKGAPWAPGDLPLSPVPGDQGRLTLALDGSGGVLAAWIDNRAGPGLYLQQVDAQGLLRLGSGREVATGIRHPQQPHLVLAAPGRVAVVWLEEKADSVWDLKRRVVTFQEGKHP